MNIDLSKLKENKIRHNQKNKNFNNNMNNQSKILNLNLQLKNNNIFKSFLFLFNLKR